jgi:N-acetylglutamate synthase-like GNAT family acetyltransferase
LSQTLDYSPQGLPLSLGNGLVLRWAQPAEADTIADFVARIAGGGEPEEPLRWATYTLTGTEEHPTTRIADFLVVVDENEGGKIVSSTALISQTWTYDRISFPVGQPEAVMTDPMYRRKGLVRKQFEILHARSAARGELIQVISGIDWYYRQFGYAMALDLGGARRLYWASLPMLPEGQTEIYRQRPATLEDVTILTELYPFHCQQSLLNRQRDHTVWRYELTRNDQNSLLYQKFWVVEDQNGNPIGYYQGYFRVDLNMMAVTEVGVKPEHSWRSISEFICRSLKAEADELGKDTSASIFGINFGLGTAHALYDALGRQLEQLIPPYAWYVRVPDLPAFLWKIAPVLEKRLAHSPFVGYSGQLRLNFYRSGLILNFETGKLSDIQPYQPDQPSDGNAMFPDLTFLDVLFGRRSLDEMRYIWVDCHASDETNALLVNSLFPPHPSCVLQLL